MQIRNCCCVMKDPESANADGEKWQDVNSVSSLLKLFFRKLPDSLITDGLCFVTMRLAVSNRLLLF